jgi:hypothetical protein
MIRISSKKEEVKITHTIIKGEFAIIGQKISLKVGVFRYAIKDKINLNV